MGTAIAKIDEPDRRLRKDVCIGQEGDWRRLEQCGEGEDMDGEHAAGGG